MKPRILLLEDNPLTARGLEYLLTREGYQVEVKSRVGDVDPASPTMPYQLLLFDVALPDGESLELARTLKARFPTLPIIFLTAKSDQAAVVRGLELGADDYIAKPFHNRELLLRIHNLLQRQEQLPQTTHFRDLTFSAQDNILRRGDQAIVLTALEHRILARLIAAPGAIVSRADLMDEIYDASGKAVTDNALSACMKRLRQKLGHPDYIETIKSLGYRLAPEGNER